jgi:hypothetical protein
MFHRVLPQRGFAMQHSDGLIFIPSVPTAKRRQVIDLMALFGCGGRTGN